MASMLMALMRRTMASPKPEEEGEGVEGSRAIEGQEVASEVPDAVVIVGSVAASEVATGSVEV
jgi:hypothetical protein